MDVTNCSSSPSLCIESHGDGSRQLAAVSISGYCPRSSSLAIMRYKLLSSSSYSSWLLVIPLALCRSRPLASCLQHVRVISKHHVLLAAVGHHAHDPYMSQHIALLAFARFPPRTIQSSIPSPKIYSGKARDQVKKYFHKIPQRIKRLQASSVNLNRKF